MEIHNQKRYTRKLTPKQARALFTPSYLPFTYRAWNVDELLSLFNDDSELCLVAEDVKSGKILGFALGVILKRPQSSWKYGYFNWVGV